MASPAEDCQRSSMDESLTNITWLDAVNLPGSLEEAVGPSSSSTGKDSKADSGDGCSANTCATSSMTRSSSSNGNRGSGNSSAVSSHSGTTSPFSQAAAREQHTRPTAEPVDSQESSVTAGDQDVDAAACEQECRPPYSYASLIAMAIQAAPDKSVSLGELYDWFENNYPYYKTAKKGWKNSIRHNLTLRVCFQRVPMVNGRGSRWVLKKCRQTDELLAVKDSTGDHFSPTDDQLDHSLHQSLADRHQCNSTELSSSHTSIGEPPCKRVFFGKKLYAGKENVFSERSAGEDEEEEEEVFVGPLPPNVLASVCQHLGTLQHLYVLPQRAVHSQLRDCGVPLNHLLASSQLTPTTTPTAESTALPDAHPTSLPILQHRPPQDCAKMPERVIAHWYAAATPTLHAQHLGSTDRTGPGAAQQWAGEGSASSGSSTSTTHPLSAKSRKSATNIELPPNVPGTPRSTRATPLSPGGLSGANQLSTNRMLPADRAGIIAASTPLRDAPNRARGARTTDAGDRGTFNPWTAPTPPTYFGDATELMCDWGSADVPGYPGYASSTLATDQHANDHSSVGDMRRYIFSLADPASHITLSTEAQKVGNEHGGMPVPQGIRANSMPSGVQTPSRRARSRTEGRISGLTPGFTNNSNFESLLGLSPSLFKPSYEQFPISPLNLTSFSRSPQFTRVISTPPAQERTRRPLHNAVRPVLSESNVAAEPAMSR